ncbi:hypothetical protein AVEN_259921-1 [Araneus ventricosus]|uniref:non-specific serine/threonine protein kinase n=1 Tax=Araneus ventricosus TaxID=182803 RepID=A0A4Y2MLM6_ARAVE|nr:hypothetical protein AVEN_259921-1 [Araneus ventricosus]
MKVKCNCPINRMLGVDGLKALNRYLGLNSSFTMSTMSSLFTKLRSSKKSSKKDQTPSEIGIPFSVKHNIHVGFNQDTGEIEGLPEPWLRLLQQANIR